MSAVVDSHLDADRSHVDASQAVRAEMAAGSVMLWLGETLHGASKSAGTNRTEEERRGLLFIYNLGWLRGEHNFHHAIPLDVQRRFDPVLQDLIGLTGDNAMEHEWYTGPVYTQPYMGAASKHMAHDPQHANKKVAGGGTYE